jgi:hypothetical protein
VGAGGSAAYASVGRFTADGAGNLSNGELDANSASARAARSAEKFAGTYAIGADHRGVMTFKVVETGSVTFPIAILNNGNAQFISADAMGGAGMVGSGTIEKVDSGAYSTAAINGEYAFGVSGFDVANSRTGFVGRFTANGEGVLYNGTADINERNTTKSVIFTAASYTVSDTAIGRGTMRLATSVVGASRLFNFVFYVVNAGSLFAMETDTVADSTSLLNGLVLRQRTPPAGFSDDSWRGDSVVYLTARTTCGTGSYALVMLSGFFNAACGNETAPVPVVLAGLFTADGHGGVSLAFDQNCGGMPDSVANLSGTYNVTSNGRTAITIKPYHAVAYLVDSRQAFLLGTDSSGFMEAQADTALTSSAMTGSYAGVTTTPASPGAVIFSGAFDAVRSGPTGNLIGTEDIGNASGVIPDHPFAATYSISSSPINGRGIIASRSRMIGVVYMVSPTKFVAIPLNDPNPAVWMFQR